MKKLILIIAVVAMGVLSFSCSDDTGSLLKEEAQGQQKPHCLSPEQAKQNVEAFLEALENSGSPAARSLSGKKREISDIQVIGNALMPKLSRSVEIPDTLFYVVNFADSAGFAITGAQPGQEPIYALIDNGTYDTNGINNSTLTDPNPGFTGFLEDAVFEWGGGGIAPPAPEFIIDEWLVYSVIKPVVKANWGQHGGYGRFFKNHTAGCTIIAAAQILYKFSTPEYVEWTEDDGTYHSSEIHWPGIKLNCSIYNGKLDYNKTPNAMDEVAHLCRFLGREFKADDTKSDGTHVSSPKVIEWFKNKSGLHATDLKKYDGEDIVDAIQQGKIVYARGENKAGKGHAWVIDGYISAKRNGKREDLLYCNWGFDGDKNGYYLSKVFNANVGPEISLDSINSRSENDVNICQDYKYSVIYK